MDAETQNRPVNQDSIASWLTLRLTAGIGSTTFHTLLNHFSHVDAVLAASHQQLSATNISAKAIDALTCQPAPDISADLAWLEAEDHHILTLNDAAYPARLKQLHDAPPAIICKRRH